MNKTTRLRHLLDDPDLTFLMEAHNGMSARVAQEAGFEALWASGLSISCSLGVRDSNEASWTQVLEVVEFMADSTSIPILLDGDTGYGNFNNMRRLVRKLEQRGVGGVCIEDKLFPKTNSFLGSGRQELADMQEFCGKIQAGKEAQADDDFVIVARIEALIAGWGMEEALRRAEAYRVAGADAILIHSRKRTADEVLTFRKEWGDRLPVVIVPTKYYSTPTPVFREAGFSAVIWANHQLRASLRAMQEVTRTIHREQSLTAVEDDIASLAEVFHLQGAAELEEAEQRFLPAHANQTRAIILATARGEELGSLTEHQPKCMVPVAGRPILSQMVDSFRAVGVRDIAVVRGYCKEAIQEDGLTFYDLDDWESSNETAGAAAAVKAFDGHCILCFGDLLFKRYILQELLDAEDDFVLFADTNWQESRNRERFAEYVVCDQADPRRSFHEPVRLTRMTSDRDDPDIHGEWMGFLKLSERGSAWVKKHLQALAEKPEELGRSNLIDLLQAILDDGQEVRVLYTTGSWLDVDTLEDLSLGGEYS